MITQVEEGIILLPSGLKYNVSKECWIITCNNCGGEFSPKRNHTARYCSVKCRVQAHRNNKRKEGAS